MAFVNFSQCCLSFLGRSRLPRLSGVFESLSDDGFDHVQNIKVLATSLPVFDRISSFESLSLPYLIVR
jgi:hypothetical protein